MDEEQRLKALLSLEKVTVSGKADRLVAERAQHQRHAAKLEHRRTQYRYASIQLSIIVDSNLRYFIQRFPGQGYCRGAGGTKEEAWFEQQWVPPVWFILYNLKWKVDDCCVRCACDLRKKQTKPSVFVLIARSLVNRCETI